MEPYKSRPTVYLKFYDDRTGETGGAHFPDIFGELHLNRYKNSLRMYRLLQEAPEMLKLLEGQIKAKRQKKATPDLRGPVSELMERLNAPRKNCVETGEVL